MYEMRNEILYRKTNDGRILFYVPKDMENHVPHKYHNEWGHIGRDKMMEAISKIGLIILKKNAWLILEIGSSV